MPDATVVHIGENSPEYVAYQLMWDVARLEGKVVGMSKNPTGVDREWLLSTYAECLEATKGNRSFSR